MKHWFPLLCFVPFLGSAIEIPPAVLPVGVGVNIHFVRGHEPELAMIQAAGFKFVRMDFSWPDIETRKGQYDWTGYEELLDNLDRHGLRAILILDYSHPLYEKKVTAINPMDNKPHETIAAPRHRESVAAFARWAAAGASHFRGRHVIWEIWNEPNIEFWSPKPDVGHYSVLALATAKAIRAAAPEATIVGPASSEFPWDFLEAFCQSGILEYLDGVSVHPYRKNRPPETAAADFQRLRLLVDHCAPSARKGKIPIISGEWGYSTYTRGVSAQTQAGFAVRQQLHNLYNGIPLSIWYDWMNDGSDPTEKEQNWGTVMPDLKPKPAYVALKTMTHELVDFRISRRLPLASPLDYVLVFADTAGRKRLAGWTIGEPHAVEVALSIADPAGLVKVDSTGATAPAKTESGRLVFDLTASPQYVRLGEAAVTTP
jgi:polysaccharide biosynthesis protein PslG